MARMAAILACGAFSVRLVENPYEALPVAFAASDKRPSEVAALKRQTRARERSTRKTIPSGRK